MCFHEKCCCKSWPVSKTRLNHGKKGIFKVLRKNSGVNFAHKAHEVKKQCWTLLRDGIIMIATLKYLALNPGNLVWKPPVCLGWGRVWIESIFYTFSRVCHETKHWIGWKAKTNMIVIYCSTWEEKTLLINVINLWCWSSHSQWSPWSKFWP